MSLSMEKKHLQPVLRSPHNNRKLSCEEIIDEMEKEQDAAVVRLLREVDRLKAENLQLRKQIHSNSFASSNGSGSGSSRQSSQFSNESPLGVDSEYHYMLPSHRSSLARGTSLQGASTFHPIDTSIPTQTVQRKRGASITSPRTSMLSVDSSPVCNGEVVDPLHDVPRPWSGAGGGSPAEAARRWQEYRIR
ncbi:hypothetical protein ZYGR_0AD00640 [Zygosaccharomyces rouxii]|uniref:ZYRO0G07370p n=2 Tax=Zygosaccharomyces rouxii TaxID=4956 RepID=C5DZU8_ZYGRC|nr:uncharacterized protein ZYRO0G07370g [Zygosaccharomyces rouxii]KAH9202379.1 hypothetical protein LQ764DRAFT_20810 [Zygosaccharomyces rouxii]GAV50881.1 hypothetical protein ZYGR_0AD00640 [Zygosaccharomyces rouxii]CAR29382.1 ZYRO0G07370p [Zygosaccharomyces rouxii]